MFVLHWTFGKAHRSFRLAKLVILSASLWLTLDIEFVWACKLRAQSIPPQPAFSDEPFIYNDATRTASINTCAKILEEFKPYLSDDQRNMLKSISILISPSLDASLVQARGNGTEKEIEISVGFIEMASLVSDIMVFNELPNAADKSWGYLAYVARIATGNARITGTGRSQEKIQSFPRFLGASQSEERDLYSNNRIHAMRESMYKQNLAVTLGHELAHHFFKHLEGEHTLAERRVNEAKADRFAIELAIKSGHQPFMAVFPFLLFVQLEDIFQIAPDSSDHPEPACRAGTFIDAGISSMRADSGFVEHLKRRGEYDSWNRGMNTLSTGIKEHCASPNSNLLPAPPERIRNRNASSQCMDEMPAKCLSTCLRRGIDPEVCEKKACRVDSAINQQAWSKACAGK